MIRNVYRCLLWLHPPVFRRQFGGEMLWIFDETGSPGAIWLLFLDALVSLARQWLLRSGVWKLLAAAAGGLAQITAGGLGFVLFHRHSAEPPAAPALPAAADPEVQHLMYLAVYSVGCVASSVILLTLWVKRFIGRRIHDT